MRKPLHKPFKVAYTITLIGETVSIQDKIIALLKDCMIRGYINHYSITSEINTLTITFMGVTISDGVPTTTTPMIRDKIIYLIEDCIAKGLLTKYSLDAEVDLIKEEKIK